MTTRPIEYASPSVRRGRRGWVRSRLSRWHAGIALVMWLGFSVLTLAITVSATRREQDRAFRVAATTACVPLGPMTGAVSREMQGCCLDFSLTLLPYCLAGLLGATVVQLVVPPGGFWVRGLRLLLWTAGLFVWFGSGIASFAHALS